MNCPTVIAVAVFIVVSGATSTAYADPSDAKVHPAALCRAELGTAGVMEVLPDATIINASPSAPLNVICPIYRDSVYPTVPPLGADGWGADAVVFDRDPVNDVFCEARSHEPFSAVHDSASAASSGFQGGVGLPDTLSMSVSTHVHQGYSTIRCTIPPDTTGQVFEGGPSQLVSYRVVEGDTGASGTDSKTLPGASAELVAGIGFGQQAISYDSLGTATQQGGLVLETWLLPFIRDTVERQWNRMFINVFDADQDGEISCFVSVRSQDGLIVTGEGLAQSDGTGEQTLEITPTASPSETGPQIVFCMMPPNGTSSVLSYEYEED